MVLVSGEKHPKFLENIKKKILVLKSIYWFNSLTLKMLQILFKISHE